MREGSHGPDAPAVRTAALTLILSGILQLATAASFSITARAVRVEFAHASEPSAPRAFVAWWLGIAAFLLLQSGVTLYAAFAPVAVAPYVAIAYLGDACIALGIWGITYYVAYLWTGRASLRVPLAIFFAAIAVVFVSFQQAHGPVAVVPHAWLVELTFATPLEGPIYTAILACFALPPIVSCLGYLSLLPRTPRRDQRYRIALVSLSIVLYLGSGLVVRLGTSDLLMFVNLALVGLGTALAALLAYHPPRALRPWLGLEERAVKLTREERREIRRAAVVARCRDLI